MTENLFFLSFFLHFANAKMKAKKKRKPVIEVFTLAAKKKDWGFHEKATLWAEGSTFEKKKYHALLTLHLMHSFPSDQTQCSNAMYFS